MFASKLRVIAAVEKSNNPLREIFGIVRFWTFSTISARSRLKRASIFHWYAKQLHPRDDRHPKRPRREPQKLVRQKYSAALLLGCWPPTIGQLNLPLLQGLRDLDL